MNMFSKFAELVASGMVFTIKIQQGPGANGQMRLDILPETAPGKSGIVIPARALLATPAELDQEVPGFLDLYLSSTADLRDQIAITEATMAHTQAAAVSAAAEARKTPKAGKTVKGDSVKADKPDGLITTSADDDEEDDLPLGGSPAADPVAPSTPEVPPTQVSNDLNDGFKGLF